MKIPTVTPSRSFPRGQKIKEIIARGIKTIKFGITSKITRTRNPPLDFRMVRTSFAPSLEDLRTRPGKISRTDLHFPGIRDSLCLPFSGVTSILKKAELPGIAMVSNPDRFL